MAHRRPPSLLALACAVLLATAGCSAGRRADRITGFSGSRDGGWEAPIARDHPLVGTTFDVARERAVARDDLSGALAAADVVLLGEQHDNVDHHRLQELLLRGLLGDGRRPAVAFEQLDLEDQAAVDRVLAERRDGDDASVVANRLAEAVDWAKSGWPPFDEYRPLFETAIGAGLPIRAANLSRKAMSHVLAHTAPDGGNVTVKKAAVTTDAADDVDFGDSARASLAAEIEASHCGYADERIVRMMTEAQRRRDGVMAGAVAAAAAETGAVLVAGFGHARTDYGVPLHLRHRLPGRRIVSVAFVEVIPGLATPGEYAGVLHAARLPFDYVVFTPRADDTDPCEKFRSGLEKLKSGGGSHGAKPPVSAPAPAAR